MKTSKFTCFLLLALVASFSIQPLNLLAQGTAFTYQGRLIDNSSPANGNYDLRFTVFDAVTNGSAVGGPLTNLATGVTNGLFTVLLDPGAGVFPGANRWLEIGVRTNGGSSFTNLVPRQRLSAVPYAITAGGITNSGAGLTNLNGSAIVMGTVVDARLSTNVARLNASQNFTGTNLFTNKLGVGSLAPIYPLDLFVGGFGLVHEDGVRALATFLDNGGGWLGTLSSHPLNFFVKNNVFSSLTIATNSNVGIGTDTPISPLTVVAQDYGIEHDALGVALSTFIDSSGGWFGTVSAHPLFFYVNNSPVASMTIATSGNVGIGTNNPAQKLHVIGNILATGTINGSSDRNAKANFTPVDSGQILEKVVALPITRWEYKADAEVTHIGPMAQDFYSAFAVGMDEKHISMVDADGVALAAIQGLNQKLEEKEARIKELEARLERLEQLMNGGAK